MSSTVRSFLNRLQEDGCRLFFERTGIPCPQTKDVKPRKRVALLYEAFCEAEFAARGRAEAIANHVQILSAKGDDAERALRMTCQDRPELLELLDEERSLEERIFRVWSEEAQTVDRARNLAMGFRKRDRRDYAGFTVDPGLEVGTDQNATTGAIKAIVAKIQGGRRAMIEPFDYVDDDGHTVHHISVLLERPAALLMEFRSDENAPEPIIRRGINEIAIDYNVGTGRLDVAGVGVGGAKTLTACAEAYCKHSLANAKIAPLKRFEWNLNFFRFKSSAGLTPPDGFRQARVIQITYVSARTGGLGTFRAANESDAYARLEELSIQSELAFEKVTSVILTFDRMPGEDREGPDYLTLRLSHPAGRSYDGATVEEREVITKWLDGQQFSVRKDMT